MSAAVEMQPQDEEQWGESEDDLTSRLEDQWREARAWWAPVRLKARRAREYYHMLQWTEKQQAALVAQGRPAIVINLIGKAVDNICGRERASRYDWKAAPAGEAALLAAVAITHGLKGIARQTEAKFKISEAFEDAVLGPMGWGEPGWDDSDPDQSPEFCDRVDPEEMYFDPRSKRSNLRDAKYIIRRRIVDLDDAIELAPDKEDELRAAALASHDGDDTDDLDVIEGDYDNREDPDEHRGTFSLVSDEDRRGRPRVALREHQWWKREDAQWLESLDGEKHYLEDLTHESYWQLMQQGAHLVDGKRRRYYQAIVVGRILLYRGKAKLDFGRYSYVALFAKRDRKGRPYGLVERAIPCQQEVNVARSKLNQSLRSRWLIYQQSSLGSNLSEDEVTKRLGSANFVLPVESVAGVLMGSDKADIQAWLELMREAKTEIDEVFGNNDAAYGDNSQEISGVAQQLRIQQQATNLGSIFDNLRYFRKTLGEMFLVILQKHTTPQKLQRIISGALTGNVSPTRIGPNGAPVQSAPPDFSWLGQVMAGPIYQNRFAIDIEDKAETGTERQAEMTQKQEMMGILPENLKGILLPDVLRASDWVGAEETAGKIEAAMNKPPDPGPSPLDRGAALKAHMDMAKHGATLDHQRQQAQEDRAHAIEMADIQHQNQQALLAQQPPAPRPSAGASN